MQQTLLSPQYGHSATRPPTLLTKAFLVFLLMLWLPLTGKAGDCYFHHYTSIKHSPTLSEPWITIDLCYYRGGNDGGYFSENPVLDINGEKCDIEGFLSNCNDIREEQSWYKNVQTSKNGKYSLRMYDPWRNDGKEHRVDVHIVLRSMRLGETFKIKISGKWNPHDGEHRVYEWEGSCSLGSFADWKVTNLERTAFNTVKPTFALNKWYGPTTIGIGTKKQYESKAFVFADKLTTLTFDAGKTSASPEYNYTSLQTSSQKMYFEFMYHVDFKNSKNGENGNLGGTYIYDWIQASKDLQPYFYPTKMNATPNLWNKSVYLSWNRAGSTNSGTWSIFRYAKGKPGERKLIKSDLDASTSYFTDKGNELALDYDKEYTYEVAFIPKNAAKDKPINQFYVSANASLVRSFDMSIKNILSGESSITLTWVTASFDNTNTYNFDIYRIEKNAYDRNKNAKWTHLTTIAVNNTQTEFTYEDNYKLSSCQNYYYRVHTKVMGNKEFRTENFTSKSGNITSKSRVTTMDVTKGEYTGVVKISWEANIIGTDPVEFEVLRKLKNSDSWKTIYTVKGVNTAYYYEDNTAMHGNYYDYAVRSKNQCDENTTTYSYAVGDGDGFCRSTGIVSGRISYGSGVAVPGAKVSLVRNDGSKSQFHSLYAHGKGARVFHEISVEDQNKYFGDKFTIQMYLKIDPKMLNDTIQGATVMDLGAVFALAIEKVDNKYFLPNIAYGSNSGWSASNYDTNVRMIPDKWYQVTLRRDGKDFLVAISDEDGKYSRFTKSLNPKEFTEHKNKGISVAGMYALANSTNAYIGNIDEVRVYANYAMPEEEIKKSSHTLTGSESDLFIYWPFDEGISNQTTAYDYSRADGVANSRHGNIQLCSVSEKVPPASMLNLHATTDSLGNYTVRGIPFDGDGSSYSIVPELGIHSFSPSQRNVFVSASSLVHNSIDFTDNSSFPVSGKVYYEGTSYPVEGCNIYVDGNICTKDGEIITSDAEGSFSISVPIGDHFIQVKKNGHTFSADGRFPEDPNGVGLKRTFDQALSGMVFFDNTLINFTGRVVGGSIEAEKPVGFGLSNNNVGIAKLVLTPTDTRYSLNAVLKKEGTTSRFEDLGTATVCASASNTIKSTAWRGADKDNADENKKIYIYTDSLTGEFSAMVPPLNYELEDVITKRGNTKLISRTNINLSGTPSERCDSIIDDNGDIAYYRYHYKLEQQYHSSPSFTVAQEGLPEGAFGIKEWQIEDANGSLPIKDIYTVDANGKFGGYTYGAPVFVCGDYYSFKLKGFEQYINADNKAEYTVPLEDCTVVISNALSAKQAVYEENNTDGEEAGTVSNIVDDQLQLDSLGEATYRWRAGLPNITRPYTRSISMTYKVNGADCNWSGNGLQGIILGSLPTGNNFVTSGPAVVDMILRDPPGSGSNAEWSTGSVVSQTKSRGRVWSNENSTWVSMNLGMKTSTGVGLGVCVITDAENVDDLSVGVHTYTEGESANIVSRTVTNTRTIATSSDKEYVGANGDLFIGSATNLIIGKARNVDFKRIGTGSKVEIALDDVINTGMEFTTMFSYTADYIENVLIPNLTDLRNQKLQYVAQIPAKGDPDKTMYYTTLSPDDERFGSSNHDKVVWGNKAIPTGLTNGRMDGPSYSIIATQGSGNDAVDSVQWYNSQISQWEKLLRMNEEEKVKAYENRDKTLVRNFSFDSGSAITLTEQTDHTESSSYDCTVIGSAIVDNTLGFSLGGIGMSWEMSTRNGGGTHEVNDDEQTQTASFSYNLAEDDIGDALTVDVYKYGAFAPIFRTRGGQTSAPYEGTVQTKYYEPGTVIMEGTMQIEVPQIACDVPFVTNVPTGTAANYTLRLTNASEINQDAYYKLMLIEESNPNGAKLTIDGMPLTEGRVIKVPAGEVITKSLQLCQTNTSVLDYNNIGIVLASLGQCDPTSAWGQIADTVYISAQFVPSSSAVEMALNHTIINATTKDDLTISFSQFDREYRNLKAFRIQYRKEGSTDWTMLHEYVLNAKDKTENNDFLPNDATVSYTLKNDNIVDGNYLFRVLSVSSYGNDEVYNTSREIAFVKDTQRPKPFGQPQPADGILSVGDELSVEYNKDFLKGELTEESNFIVTGVLNGATVDHATALGMTGEARTAYTDADINLAGKSFALDCWVKAKGEGVLLAHGAGEDRFAVGVDNDGHLVVNISGETYTSESNLTLDKWCYLTVSYNADDKPYKLNAAVAEGASTTTLFENTHVAAYYGIGRLSVGIGFKGAVHELTLWDNAHDITKALLEKDLTKSPATAHLIGYWKMDEGEGKDVTDYARKRHLRMTNESWYLENENKATALDGESYLTVMTGDIAPLPTDNCAIEFWMKAGEQKGDAQLIQTGKVGLWMNADGLLVITSADNAYKASSKSLADNAWHHVALNILRNGNAAVYIDGERTLATNAENIASTASGEMIVGARKTMGDDNDHYVFDRWFKGFVDEIRLWNATLTADLIKARRKTRLLGNEPGLVAYYPFEVKQLNQNNIVETIGFAGDATDEQKTIGCSSVLVFADEAPALKEKRTETNVDFSFTASDNKIVFDINESRTRIEGCTLNFTVRNLRDKNGNLSMPANWSAYVNLKELVWNVSEQTVVKGSGGKRQIDITFTNKSATQQMWSISGMPAWLHTDADYGTIEPLATRTVKFTVTESTPIGRYEETVYLTGNDGIATPLTLYITVEGDKPDWTLDADKYENTMSIVGTLLVLGSPSYDTEDIVGVFVDGECRGIAHPVYNERYDNCFLMIDVYGNINDHGRQLSFKVYDASTGTTYPVAKTSEAVCFVANSLVGKYTEPLLIEATDRIEQSTKLNSGWNWIAFYVANDDMSLASVFAPVADKTVMVKSKSRFAEYVDGSWYGSSNTLTLDNRQMFKVKTSGPAVLELIGELVSDNNAAITVDKGWNWIAYNGVQAIDIGDAFAGLNPVDGDMVKSKQGFAVWDGYEWRGTLAALVPGSGYMYRSEVTYPRTFNYPRSSARRAICRTGGMRIDESSLHTNEFEPVDDSEFAGNMTIVARVTNDGLPMENVEVGVFAGLQCRTHEYTDADGLVYLTVPGDQAAVLTFKVFTGSETLTSESTLTYRDDDIVGSRREPFPIAFGTVNGINAVGITDDNGHADWYDLHGRKINKPLQKGVYIRSVDNRAVKTTR